jgi:hypothetical protein
VRMPAKHILAIWIKFDFAFELQGERRHDADALGGPTREWQLGL